MINYEGVFNSREEIENWIGECLNNDITDEAVLSFLINRKEELKSKVDFYLTSRRLALVTGDTDSATRLHDLLKKSDTELGHINNVLLNSFYITTKKPISNNEVRKSVFSNEEIKKED